MSSDPAAASVPAAPSAVQMDRLCGVVAPLQRVTQPYLEGVDRLPARGALYVGNHTLFAFMDLPFMMAELWKRRGIVLRGLGDHGHYAIPVWRDLLQLCGMVRGTRDNVRALMAAGENVLVFPGGADEVFKGRGQKYELLWKERLGFARLAIEFGYPVVPFAAVGAEDMLDVVADPTTPGVAQVSRLMKRLVGVPLPPIPRGIGPTLVPRPERLYFRFAQPITTAHLQGDASDGNARNLRDDVRDAVLGGIDQLKRFRDEDPARAITGRIRRDRTELPELAATDPEAHFVTRAFDAWNDHGPQAVAAWLAPRVELTDPPDWPDSTTTRGRGAVLVRLQTVADALGGRHALTTQAHSTATGDIHVDFTVRGQRRPGDTLGRFTADVRLGGGQITHIGVRRADPGTTPGP